MEQEIENLDSTNEEEVVAPKENEETISEVVQDEIHQEQAEDIESLKAKNQELYEQLKKAKGFIRDKDGKWVKKPQPQYQQPVSQEVKPQEDISRIDLLRLIKANVPEEDIEEVIGYAKFKKMSIADALKSAEIKAILQVKEDYRKTSAAANTGSSRRGSSQVSEDTLLSRAQSTGELPESDEDMQRLIDARMAKKAKKKN